jgi:hypothetical protein
VVEKHSLKHNKVQSCEKKILRALSYASNDAHPKKKKDETPPNFLCI